MRRIGILGGMGPEATIMYYKYLTQAYYERFRNYAFPEIVIYSVQFQRFINLFFEGRWDQAEDETLLALESLSRAGADFAIMATNTLHFVFEKVEARSPIPLLSIMEPVAEAIKIEGMKSVGLLGTIFTMKEGFYRNRLVRDGIETIVPAAKDQESIQGIIFSELTIGEFKDESKSLLLRIINDLGGKGAQGIILGCTEIPLILRQEDCPLKLFDSTLLHAKTTLACALE